MRRLLEGDIFGAVCWRAKFVTVRPPKRTIESLGSTRVSLLFGHLEGSATPLDDQSSGRAKSMKRRNKAGNDEKVRENYNVISTLRKAVRYLSVISVTSLM
jgi:hypothetical protein